jgi:type I restriction enzyme S subunit
MSYELVPLGELGEIVAGSTPDTNNQKYWGGDISWITPADLTNHEGIFFTGNLRKITEAGYKSCSTKMLPPGSILFSSRAPIGHCAVTSFPLCTNQGFKSIIPNEKLDSVYGFFALKYFTPQIEMLGRGATFAEVNKEIFENFTIPLPPLDEQKRIASLLARADRLRGLRRAARALGQSLLQGVFLEMFGDPETNPKGWDADDFEKTILSTQNGFGQREDFSPNGTIVLRIRDISSGRVDLSDPRRMIIPDKELAKYALESNDLIVVRVNGNPNYVGIASEFAAQKEPVVFSDHVIRIRMKKEILNTTFVVYLLNSPYGRKQTLGNVSTTAGQFTINSSGLSRIKMIHPPLSLQEEFAGVVARVEGLRGRMGESARQVDGLFESLLAESFNA